MPGVARWVGSGFKPLADAAFQCHAYFTQHGRYISQLVVQLLQIVLYAGVLNADAQHEDIPLE